MKKHPDANCEACPLQGERNAYVPSTIVEGATIAFVGEAPGKQEKVTGKPFVGPSGKLLDTVLTEHGIDRNNCIVTNTCLCLPPDKHAPTKDEIACCAPRLTKELQGVKQIVALGGTATGALLDDRKVRVTKARIGAPKRNTARFPDAVIVPTFHPAACLRAADNFPYLVNDIGKLVGKNYLGYKPPVWYAPTDPKEAINGLEYILHNEPVIAVDIETKYDKDGPVEPSHLIEPLCIGIGYGTNAVLIIDEALLTNFQVVDTLRRVLEACHIIAHNGKYDVSWLRASIAPECTLWFDTMLASYCYDERPGTHSLDYLGREVLGTPDWKAEVGAWGGHLNMPKDRLFEYNANDIAATLQLWAYYEELFSKDLGLRKLHDFLVDASNAMIPVEQEGVLIDVEFLAELEEKYQEELRVAEQALVPWLEPYVKDTKRKPNPRSPKQVAKVMRGFGYRIDSTDADTIMRYLFKETGLSEQLTRDDLLDLLNEDQSYIKNERAEFLWRLLNYRKEQKLYGTYIKGTRKRLYNSRLYPTFLFHSTTTGRLSCRNPNVQNIPRGSSIRNLFVPERGNIFIQADYSQAELRTIGALAHDEYLKTVFSEGRDIHSEVAKEFFGADFTKEHRVKAKMVVFGLSYDMSAKGLAERLGIPLVQAKKFLDKFFEVIPQVDEWRRSVHRQVFEEGVDLETPFGRRRRFMLVTRDNQQDIKREALAFFPQSIASDICLTAFINLQSKLEGLAKFRITVHDSILVECKVEDTEKVAQIMKETMEAAALVFTDFLPFKVDIATGYAWGALEDYEVGVFA